MLDHHELHLMIQGNPDGRKHAEASLYWRKTTNQNYCGPTRNYRGADLNRNFEYVWNGVAGGSSGNQCDDTEDNDKTRADEIIGFIIIDAGGGKLNAVQYEARLGADILKGVLQGTYTYQFTSPFTVAPTVGIVAQAAIDGVNGSWPVLTGAIPFSADGFTLAVDEDPVADPERSHTTEQAAYLVFESAVNVPLTSP